MRGKDELVVITRQKATQMIWEEFSFQLQTINDEINPTNMIPHGYMKIGIKFDSCNNRPIAYGLQKKQCLVSQHMAN